MAVWQALARCTASIVAKQLAEDECRTMQREIDLLRVRAVV